MTEADIRKYDPEDAGLKEVMGDKFHDGKFPDNGKKADGNSGYVGKFSQPRSKAVTAESSEVSEDTAEDENVTEAASHKPKAPVPALLSQYTKPTAFGGITGLLFYWMNTGLMEPSVAVPSMLVCAALFGFGIGKAVSK